MKNIYEHTSHISRLIVKEITGAINADEKQHIDSWRKTSPENEVLYQKLYSNNFHKDQYKMMNECDPESALSEMQLRIKAVKKKKKQKLYNIVAAAAAVILVLVIGRISVFNNGVKNVDPNGATKEVAVENKNVILQLSDGSMVSLDTLNTLNEKGVILSKTGERILRYNNTTTSESEENNELVYNEIIVPKGSDYDLILSDGTAVKLNAESRLKFPVEFKKQDRIVTLDGEGYFSVTKDAEHPFIVETVNQKVKVLGTEFNISGYANEEKVYTTLVEGRINVLCGDKEVEVSPGEQTVINRNDGHIMKRKVDVSQYVAWKDGYFILEDQSLDVIMRKFERWYDIEVSYSDVALKNVIFKGQIPKYTPLEETLLILEKTTNLYFKIDGKKITIYATR